MLRRLGAGARVVGAVLEEAAATATEKSWGRGAARGEARALQVKACLPDLISRVNRDTYVRHD